MYSDTFYKRHEFKAPTEPPTQFQKMQAHLRRAANNVQYGFDGRVSHLNLGPLAKVGTPITPVESKLTQLLANGQELGLLLLSSKLLAQKLVDHFRENKKLENK